MLDLQRKVSIIKGKLRKHSTNRCHAYIFDIAIGSARELAPSEILSADSTDYLLGGSLTLRNGRIDKLQFEEGYCQAVEYSGNASQDNFTFHYYDRDHLGNIRQVIKATGSYKGTVIQTMDYYPFGAQFCSGSTDSNVQPYKYNGKELDRMHGLDTYDYGARQYDPVTARWDRMDPLCEKYYSMSPYVYCGGNPVRYVDPDGDKIVDAKMRNQVYVANGKICYTRYVDKNTKTVINALLLTKTGRKQLLQMINSKTNINISISERTNSNNNSYTLGETKQYKDGNDNGIREDPKSGKMYIMYAYITIFKGSIKKVIERNGLYKGLSIQQAIGAVAGHESVHASDSEEIDKDLKYQKEHKKGNRKDGEKKPRKIEEQIINEY